MSFPSVDRIIRPKEASVITGCSLTSIWRYLQAGDFPPKIKLGEHSVGFRLSELQAWIDSRAIVTANNVQQVAPGVRKGRKPRQAQEVIPSC